MVYVDWELLLPVSFVLLASLGIVYGAIAAVHYFRSRKLDDSSHVPVAIALFAVQYVLGFTLPAVSNYLLFPTILMFLIVVALLIAIRLGLQPHSKGGVRIALAALFTLGAYICKVGNDYYQSANFYR